MIGWVVILFIPAFVAFAIVSFYNNKRAAKAKDAEIENQLSEEINSVLTEWNPLKVDKNISTDEYRKYVPLILEHLNDESKLMEVLENILVKHLGVDYDPQNMEHIMDLRKACDLLIKIVYKNK